MTTNRLVLSQVRAEDAEGATTLEVTPVMFELWHVEQFHLSRCDGQAEDEKPSRSPHHGVWPERSHTTAVAALGLAGVALVLLLFFGHRLGQWRREVKKASQCRPNMHEHFRFTGVVYQEKLLTCSVPGTMRAPLVG